MSPKPQLAKNIPPAGCVDWDPTDILNSLSRLRDHVTGIAHTAIEWYWQHIQPKRRMSQFVQGSAIVLAALGGLVPVLASLAKSTPGGPGSFDSGLAASLLVGVAAGLVALDKAFGFSTAWARYVLAATTMKKALTEFTVDWAELMSEIKTQAPGAQGQRADPTPDQVRGLMQKAKELITTVEGVILQETKDWVTEFQSNMAQVEKDVRAQLDSLKAKADEEQQAREAASKPASIELTVSDADKTDQFQFEVKLTPSAGAPITEIVNNRKVWSQLSVPVGHCVLRLAATVQNRKVQTERVVEVKPGEIAKMTISLLQ